MTKDDHDRMVHDFVGHLIRTTSSLRYATEYPVRLDEKNVGFVDVVIWSGEHLFLFDMKSESSDFSRDIQQLKRYRMSLSDSPAHSWRKFHAFLVYDGRLRERVLEVRNVFAGIGVMLMDSGKDPSNLDGENLKTILGPTRRRIGRLRMILRILVSRSV